MRANRLREMWQRGEGAVNGWLQIPTGFAAELMAAQPWDSLTLDLQHGPVDYQRALEMLQALSHSGVTPLARVPWNEPGIIMKLLDAGAFGIICPMVNNREQAERFVGACRYPPKGYRSFGPTRALLYAGADYPAHANDTVIAMAMIETAEAVDNLDAILDTPGLDGVYIGPADLSQSLGGKERVDLTEPRMVEVLDRILDGCKQRDLIAGIHTMAPAYARGCLEQGYKFVTIQSDGRLLAGACQAAIAAAKGQGGEGGKKSGGPY
jgi:4-hydroxy-2-oxoheptanedioate aldolase